MEKEVLRDWRSSKEDYTQSRKKRKYSNCIDISIMQETQVLALVMQEEFVHTQTG